MVKEWTVEESKSIVKNCNIVEGEIYINKKNGNEYKFQGAEIHSETLEPMVAYIDYEQTRWTRPYHLFFEKFFKKEA